MLYLNCLNCLLICDGLLDIIGFMLAVQVYFDCTVLYEILLKTGSLYNAIQGI